MMEGLCLLPNVDLHGGAHRGASFINRTVPYSLKGEPTLAFENRWQHNLRHHLMSEDAEGQAFQVGFSTAILSLEENCGSDYNR